jgi:hypothetical protein
VLEAEVISPAYPAVQMHWLYPTEPSAEVLLFAGQAVHEPTAPLAE